MRTNTLICSVGLFVFAVGFGRALSQVNQGASTESPQSLNSQSRKTLQVFRSEQLTLGHEEQTLIAQGATEQEIVAWHQQNAARFAFQNQRAALLSTLSFSQTEKEGVPPNIPANAPSAQKAFFIEKAALANARAHIHNQIITQAASTSASLSPAIVQQLMRRENQLFQQQYGASVILQEKRAHSMALVAAQTARTVPPLATIPPHAAPAMASYLTTRSQVMRSWVQLTNQYAAATPAEKQAALETWRQQNAGQIAQLKQQALALSQTSTTN